MTLLTVCVPTIPGRESLLSRCLFHLTAQPIDNVEILVVEGEGPLGDKVNHAAALARGEYFTVVDDDDWVADSYVDEIHWELADRVDPLDYIGLKVLEQHNGRFHGVSVTSGEFKTWGDSSSRGPVPKGITRTGIVRQVPMGNDYFADRHWCVDVARHVQSWAFIDRCLYMYDAWDAHSAFQANLVRFVGWWPFDESKVTRTSLEAAHA